jgi:hypothetical protein
MSNNTNLAFFQKLAAEKERRDAERERTINIKFIIADKDSIDLAISPLTPISEVKAILKTHIGNNNIILSRNNVELLSGRMLTDYGIFEDVTICVM